VLDTIDAFRIMEFPAFSRAAICTVKRTPLALVLKI
jgi:hypothetical protein